MTTYTKIELINTAINRIRICIELYKEHDDIRFINSANDIANSLFALNIITYNKATWLSNIISHIAFPNASQFLKD